ncbi:hypothetical protein N3K66_000937 [Trichothecium roseum]|uniref:Uncharacterized protein n=1 Tax=Trichothecium roseum TaxID=47278 RepID=A0ACC0VE61_9HYPO|nr:hypothetical protein N3K66_000937 [Trichothecium roseum]
MSGVQPENETQRQDNDANQDGSGLGVSRQQTQEYGYVPSIPGASNEHLLHLRPGDAEIFNDVIESIETYLGVLERQESLSSCVGVKLTGSHMLKGVDKFFEGPVRIIPQQPYAHTIKWTDILHHARTSPQDFVPTTLRDGTRVCYFYYNGFKVEISDVDWQVICSGTLERLPWNRSMAVDELAEVATVNLLQQRSCVLYYKACEIAEAARELYHGTTRRKLAIPRHWRQSQSIDAGPLISPTNLQAPAPSYELQPDMPGQCIASSPSPSVAASGAGAGAGSGASAGAGAGPSQNSWSPRSPECNPNKRETRAAKRKREAIRDAIRPTMIEKMARLHRGDEIRPGCDRCRRLNLLCFKNLTACVGCEKRHAKCTWKGAPDDDAQRMRDNPNGDEPPTPPAQRRRTPSRGDFAGPAAFMDRGILSDPIMERPRSVPLHYEQSSPWDQSRHPPSSVSWPSPSPYSSSLPGSLEEVRQNVGVASLVNPY